MKSHAVIKQAIDPIGVKQVSARLNLSTSLVYKWCQEPTEAPGDDSSGARNPLDRIAALWEYTGDNKLIDWLCRQADGTFIPDIPSQVADHPADYVQHTQEMISNFSELLQVVSESMADDGCVDANEAEKIRTEWQELKQQAEAFVLACEKGLFNDAS